MRISVFLNASENMGVVKECFIVSVLIWSPDPLPLYCISCWFSIRMRTQAGSASILRQ